MSEVQIKLFDYRNASYQGQANEYVPQGLGSCLTEDFLYCISMWDKGQLNGPCFVVFPSEKLLYGIFSNNNAENLVCYELSKECQLYCMYRDGKMDRHVAASFPYIRCILEVYLGENDIIERQQEHDYENNAQKWEIVQKVFKTDIPQFMRSPTRFLHHFFVNKFKEVEEIYGSEYFFGMTGEGLGFKLNLAELLVQSIGYYDANKVLKLIGKKSINREKKVKQEGIYERIQTLVRYQQRPANIKKNYRDYFRLSIDFHNKFIYFPTLQKMQKEMVNLRTNLLQNTTNRIAQQLIQHLGEVSLQQNYDRQQEKSMSRNRFERATPMENVTLDQIKQQINRSNSKNMRDNVSPYKKYQIEPAELKYRSNTGGGRKKNQFTNSPAYNKTQILDNHTYDYDKNPKMQGFTPYPRVHNQINQHPKQPYPLRQPNYRDRIRKLNYSEDDPKDYEPRQFEQRRYPIQQNLRTNNRSTSRSPIKLQHKPVLKYQYVDDPVNPEKAQNGHNGYNSKLAERLFSPKRTPSTSPQKRTQPETKTKTRLEHLSNLYDDLQAKNKQPESDKKYALNHGRGYQYNQGQLEQKMGLVKGERRVQSPKRTSPDKPKPRYTPNYPKYEYKYDKQRENRYDNLDYRRPSREKKTNYGYFDKNR